MHALQNVVMNYLKIQMVIIVTLVHNLMDVKLVELMHQTVLVVLMENINKK